MHTLLNHACTATGSGAEDWAQAIELAAREVFQIMLSTDLERDPRAKNPRVSECTAMVGLAGKLCGILSIRCSAKAASRMASNMLGTEVELGNDVWGAVGEICNMIAGNFKAKIADLNNSCMLSVPTVINGADYSLHPMADGQTIEVFLALEREPVLITLHLHGDSTARPQVIQHPRGGK